ncbi:MAG TPA: hypothetical protein VFD32_02780 [Dehalococcoidia bacterium]|nr:hypothetical protein [Dehalococcoidia bacterium]
MRKHLALIAALATAAFTLFAAFPGVASAHEKRQIGAFTFVVGFLNEPAIVDQPNSIDLTITDANNQPVSGAEKTLKAQLIYGGETQEMTLSPRFNAPGKYNAYFIPTKTGTWKFHFTGSVDNQAVDELFTSGPGRFNDVAGTSELDFPAKTPDQVTLSARAADAKSAADSAKTVAIVGIAVGALGVVLGLGGLGFGLSARRRASAANTTTAGGAGASMRHTV